VVDDEPELLRMIGQTLGAAGFTAVGAASGERALELASQQEFDAALVDKNLGRGIDGVEVLRHLRKRQPRCACIVMTAFPSMGSAVEALRIGRTTTSRSLRPSWTRSPTGSSRRSAPSSCATSGTVCCESSRCSMTS